MARPLRKRKLDGTPYFRREKVESEIQALAGISAAELERRADLWQVGDPRYVSPEALLYFVRNAASGAHREKLTEKLLLRVARRVPSAANADGKTVSMTKMNIREAVRDHFVDLLLSDRNQYDDRLDYYEVNFNSAVAADRRTRTITTGSRRTGLLKLRPRMARSSSRSSQLSETTTRSTPTNSTKKITGSSLMRRLTAYLSSKGGSS